MAGGDAVDRGPGNLVRQMRNIGHPRAKSASIHDIIADSSGTMSSDRRTILAAKVPSCTSIRISS